MLDSKMVIEIGEWYRGHSGEQPSDDLIAEIRYFIDRVCVPVSKAAQLKVTIVEAKTGKERCSFCEAPWYDQNGQVQDCGCRPRYHAGPEFSFRGVKKLLAEKQIIEPTDFLHPPFWSGEEEIALRIWHDLTYHVPHDLNFSYGDELVIHLLTMKDMTEAGFSKKLKEWYRGHIILPVFASYSRRPGFGITHKIVTETPPMARWL